MVQSASQRWLDDVPGMTVPTLASARGPCRSWHCLDSARETSPGNQGVRASRAVRLSNRSSRDSHRQVGHSCSHSAAVMSRRKIESSELTQSPRLAGGLVDKAHDPSTARTPDIPAIRANARGVRPSTLMTVVTTVGSRTDDTSPLTSSARSGAEPRRVSCLGA
jgi:hypothetical protein